MLFPLAIVNPLQLMIPIEKVPPLLMLVMLLYPFGTTSPTATPVAALGPALLTVIVKVTTSPTFGVELLTVFIKLKSATCGVTGSVSSSSCIGASASGVGSG